MAYGMQFINGSDVVVLDSEISKLSVLYKGTWSHRGSGVIVSFPSPVTTQEPPLVFVRANQTCTMCFCMVSGSAGAWTGFTFLGIVGQVSSGSWFAAAFTAAPVASYGFRIWDGASKLLFDSGTPAAQFTRSISAWTYLGSERTGQGLYRLSWTAPSPLNLGDFMLLNNIAMDVAGGTSRQGNMYAVWDFANNRLVIQVVGVDIMRYLYVPAVFAKPLT